MTTAATEIAVRLKRPHSKQQEFIDSTKKRRIVRAGRRGGKTTGMAILAVDSFIHGHRVLYAVPTADQLDRFWFEVKRALEAAIDAKVVYVNETRHVIEVPGTNVRIRGKTAWNADTLRGDYADVLILDEWQHMDETAWSEVGSPMLMDNNGDAVFIYTPPSLHSRSVSKARDKMHAAKLFKAAQADERWDTFHFSSHDNPHISREGLSEVAQDMTDLAYRQEILAEDIDEVPGALWTRAMIAINRIDRPAPLKRIVVAIDPAVTSSEQSDETGIVVAGIGEDGHGYVLHDGSGHYSPDGWAKQAVTLLDKYGCDRVIGETNNGGEMVEHTLRMVRASLPYKAVHASRGKAARAEPVAALYEQGKVHHVGDLPELEDQLVTWEPLGGDKSPDRLDALVWALTELMVNRKRSQFVYA